MRIAGAPARPFYFSLGTPSCLASPRLACRGIIIFFRFCPFAVTLQFSELAAERARRFSPNNNNPYRDRDRSWDPNQERERENLPNQETEEKTAEEVVNDDRRLFIPRFALSQLDRPLIDRSRGEGRGTCTRVAN